MAFSQFILTRLFFELPQKLKERKRRQLACKLIHRLNQNTGSMHGKSGNLHTPLIATQQNRLFLPFLCGANVQPFCWCKFEYVTTRQTVEVLLSFSPIIHLSQYAATK